MIRLVVENVRISVKVRYVAMLIKFSDGIFVSRFELDEFEDKADDDDDDDAPGDADDDDWGTANHAVGV